MTWRGQRLRLDERSGVVALDSVLGVVGDACVDIVSFCSAHPGRHVNFNMLMYRHWQACGNGTRLIDARRQRAARAASAGVPRASEGVACARAG